ncbi:MAG: GcrA cell cycle regulator [Candidatus Tokpelaia sp. JSC085]|nr:MAG: GcrA cell cycle regulator [Candidatus Tokpelaia sp. JSC085]
MIWTDERIELLKKLWAEGLTASQIATQLGSVSRNAVIGKAHRLQLASRVKKSLQSQSNMQKKSLHALSDSTAHAHFCSEKSAVQIIGTSAIRMEFSTHPIAKKNAGILHKENVVVSIGPRLGLLQLTENTCKWPFGDPLSEDFYFCGAASGEDSPYCGYHSKIAFQPLADRRRLKM